MVYYHKIAVFDLDDTLYIGNSHIEFLCKHYNTIFFKSIMFKALGKLLPSIQHKIMFFLYDRIDSISKEKFLLNFRPSVISLLKQKKLAGFHPIILSNAPRQLLINAANKLGVDYISADVSEKSSALLEVYKYNTLFVCTDNKTDIDLIELADETVITCKIKNRKYFIKNIKTKKYKFMDVEDVKC